MVYSHGNHSGHLIAEETGILLINGPTYSAISELRRCRMTCTGDSSDSLAVDVVLNYHFSFSFQVSRKLALSASESMQL